MTASFDRTNLKQIRNDINEALAQVAAKHGISLDIGNIRFSSDQFTTKITAQTRSKVTAVIATPITNTSGRIAVGSRFMAHGTEYKVVDYKPSRRKYPFVGEGPRGGRWKFTEADVRKGLVA